MTGTHKGASSTNTSAVLLLSEPPEDGAYYAADNVEGFLKVLYKRILIQKISHRFYAYGLFSLVCKEVYNF